MTTFKVLYGANNIIGTVDRQSGTSKQVVDLTTLSGWGNVKEGEQLFFVEAEASGYSSVDSNKVTVLVPFYEITVNLTNVVASEDNPTTIRKDGSQSKTLKFTPKTGYVLSDNITVTNADYTWTKSSGTLMLSNPTGAVSVTIAGVEAASGYNVTVNYSTYTSTSGTIYDGQNNSGTPYSLSSGDNNLTFKSGYAYMEGDDPSGEVDTGYFASKPTVSGDISIENWNASANNGGGSALFKVSGTGIINIAFECLIEGAQITLADGSTKAIEDITYDDELLVWNFYEGKFDTAKPKWIKIKEVAPRYNLVKFSNGAEIGFVGAGGEKGYHRIFNKEAGAFTHTGVKDTPNGTTTFAQDGTFPTVVSQEVIEKEVKFYNVITDKHYNIFANGILTSCRLSNKYRIEDMRYIGEKLISSEQEKAYFERIEDKRR